MLRAGPGRPRDLRAVALDAGQILLRNVYGWFERADPAPGVAVTSGRGLGMSHICGTARRGLA
jgi:hypothetical protein